MENFYRNAIVVFEYWLEGKGWIPINTNAIESAFSQFVSEIIEDNEYGYNRIPA